MNKILILFAFSLVTMMSCKNDAGSTTAVEPAAPSVPASTSSSATPIADPTKASDEPAVPVGPITSVEFMETEYDRLLQVNQAKLRYNLILKTKEKLVVKYNLRELLSLLTLIL